MEHDLVLLSPEKTVLTYRLASIGGRVFAHIVDIVIVFVVIFVSGILLAITGVMGQGVFVLSSSAFMIFTSVFPFLYFILFEALWNGQTLGKRALTLRVRMADGTPVTPLAAVGRNLLRPADVMPGTYFVGLLAMFTTPKSQRIGDLLANTVVVYEKRAAPTFTPAPHTAGIHPLEAQVGDLRKMTVDEYNALRRYCDRFPELAPNAQSKLTGEVWLPIAARLGVEMAPNIHPIYLAEAVVMKYGREHGLL